MCEVNENILLFIVLLGDLQSGKTKMKRTTLKATKIILIPCNMCCPLSVSLSLSRGSMAEGLVLRT